MWMKEDGEVDRSKYYMNGIYLLHSKHGMELLHGKGDSNKTFSELCAGIDAFHEHQSALSQIADTLYEKKNIALKALDEKKGFEEAYPEMSSAIRGLNPKFVDLLFKA